MIKINKEWLNKHRACPEGIQWVLKQRLRDPIKLIKYCIKKQYKLDWANWLIVRVMDYKQYVSYAVYAAEQVIDIYEKKHPGNNAPRNAINAAKKCIKYPSDKNKRAAATAGAAAVYAGVAAVYAAAAAVYAAADAADAADAAVYAADAAVYAADAAVYADAAADAAARTKMRTKILKYGLKLLGA